MQIPLKQVHSEIIPFTLDDLRNEQDILKERLETLRKGFFRRYTEWEKERDLLKKENEFLKEELHLIKSSKVLFVQEAKLSEFKLEA